MKWWQQWPNPVFPQMKMDSVDFKARPLCDDNDLIFNVLVSLIVDHTADTSENTCNFDKIRKY